MKIELLGLLILDVLIALFLCFCYVVQRKLDRRMHTKNTRWVMALFVLVLIELFGHLEMYLA